MKLYKRAHYFIVVCIVCFLIVHGTTIVTGLIMWAQGRIELSQLSLSPFFAMLIFALILIVSFQLVKSMIWKSSEHVCDMYAEKWELEYLKWEKGLGEFPSWKVPTQEEIFERDWEEITGEFDR